MREIIQDVSRWFAEGNTDIAIATVVKTFGSAPRKEGAKLAYLASGSLSGSISGGCVESAIIEEAIEVIRTGESKLVHFETSDDDAWEVGLPCGGTIDVLVEPVAPDLFNACRRYIERNEHTVQLTLLPDASSHLGGKMVIGPDGTQSGTFPKELTGSAVELAGRTLHSGRFKLNDTDEVFVDVMPPVPTLVVVGGVHTAMALVRMARILGFRTSVVDPRQTFIAAERFPDVDKLTARWPGDAFLETPLTEDTAIVVLTHDPKLDDPALEAALRSPAFYIGALGSLRTQEKRRTRLRELGFDEASLSRIHGPVGLEIGGSTPEQVALSILAEVVAVMNGNDGTISQKRQVEPVYVQDPARQ